MKPRLSKARLDALRRLALTDHVVAEVLTEIDAIGFEQRQRARVAVAAVERLEAEFFAALATRPADAPRELAVAFAGLRRAVGMPPAGEASKGAA